MNRTYSSKNISNNHIFYDMWRVLIEENKIKIHAYTYIQRVE